MILNILAVMLVSYLIGSIPFGWIIVKLATGRDLRGSNPGVPAAPMPGVRPEFWPVCLPRSWM